MKGLPKVDCKICGYKSCRVFSEVVASGKADLKQCVFVRIELERSGDLAVEESLEIMKKVWGEKKLNFRMIKLYHCNSNTPFKIISISSGRGAS